MHTSVVSVGITVALNIKCMNFFYRREMPDASDILALIAVARCSKGGSFQRIMNYSSSEFLSQTFSQAVVIIALEGYSAPYFVLTRMMIFVYTYLYLYSVVMQ